MRAFSIGRRAGDGVADARGSAASRRSWPSAETEQPGVLSRLPHHSEPMPFPRTPPKMFETRSQAWKEVGLIRQISPKVVKRARLELLVLLPLFAAIVFVYHNRVRCFWQGAPLARTHPPPPPPTHLATRRATPTT